MKATNNERQISSVFPFRELVSFDEPSIDIKSDYDFTKNLSQRHSIEDKKTRGHTAKAVSPFNTLLAHQIEIKKLQKKIKKLQHEKSTLIKWIRYLF